MILGENILGKETMETSNPILILIAEKVENSDHWKNTVKELRQLAKENNIKNYNKKSKEEIITELELIKMYR